MDRSIIAPVQQVLWVIAAGTSLVVWLILGLVVIPAWDTSPTLEQVFASAYAVFFVWTVVAMAYDARLRRRRTNR